MYVDFFNNKRKQHLNHDNEIKADFHCLHFIHLYGCTILIINKQLTTFYYTQCGNQPIFFIVKYYFILDSNYFCYYIHK